MIPRIGIIALLLMAPMSSVAHAEDNIDARIANLEKDNARLKKLLRLQELERENSALNAKILPRETPRTGVRTSEQQGERSSSRRAPILPSAVMDQDSHAYNVDVATTPRRIRSA